MVTTKDNEASDIAEGEEAEVMHPTPVQKPSLIELFGELTWEEIEADGIITLDEIEKELEAKGYPPDSHDYLHD